VLAALIFFLGVQPSWLLRWSEPTTNALVAALPISASQQVAMSNSGQLSSDSGQPAALSRP